VSRKSELRLTKYKRQDISHAARDRRCEKVTALWIREAVDAHHYAAVPGIGKWILIVCMLLGRLEIYTFLVLLVPGFWRK
jgi:hypothetical protein